MADTYTVLSMVPVTEIIGPTRTRTVYEFTVVADTSGVTFYRRLVRADINATNKDLIFGALAEEFNELAAMPGVVGVDVDQDINSQSNLDQRVHVTVESDDGAFVGEVLMKWGEFQDAAIRRNKINAMRAWLDSQAG